MENEKEINEKLNDMLKAKEKKIIAQEQLKEGALSEVERLQGHLQQLPTNEELEDILSENARLTETTKSLKNSADEILDQNESLKEDFQRVRLPSGDELNFDPVHYCGLACLKCGTRVEGHTCAQMCHKCVHADPQVGHMGNICIQFVIYKYIIYIIYRIYSIIYFTKSQQIKWNSI